MANSRLRTLVLGVALSAMSALSACTYWSNDFNRIVDQSNRDFSRDPDRTYRYVQFADVVADPSSYMLMDICFDAILNVRDENIFVPIYSTFQQENHYGFSAWAPGARLWDIDERTKSTPTIYIRKDNTDIQELLSAPRYSQINVRGRVMNDFEKLPFIEVHYIHVSGSPVFDDASVSHAGSGFHSASEKRPADAIRHLEAAAAGNVSEAAREQIHLTLGQLYEERGDFEKAIANYDEALDFNKNNAGAKAGIDRAEKALDRQRAIEAARDAAPPPPEPEPTPAEPAPAEPK